MTLVLAYLRAAVLWPLRRLGLLPYDDGTIWLSRHHAVTSDAVTRGSDTDEQLRARILEAVRREEAGEG